jgi:dTDP-glucose pyrophosphorylase
MTSTSQRLATISVRPEATIREAMQAINTGATEIAFLVEGAERYLTGTVSDGDVRRALLAGAGLEDPVAPYANRQFTSVRPETGRSEVLDLMRARDFNQIPIVDEENRLIGLHLLHEILGSVERPNWAVIMAGGRGERLRPYTDTVPKPMIKIAGRPILERLVLHFIGYGIKTIFLSIQYLGEIIEQYFGDGSRFGCEIRYLRETEPLGTAGALSLLPEAPTCPLMLANGDLITEFDAGSMLAFHDKESARITVGVREYRHTVPFGVAEVAGTQVVGFREKPLMACLANAGIYVLEPAVIPMVKSGESCTMPDLIARCIEKKHRVSAYPIREGWIDVGRPADLNLASRGEPLESQLCSS